MQQEPPNPSRRDLLASSAAMAAVGAVQAADQAAAGEDRAAGIRITSLRAMPVGAKAFVKIETNHKITGWGEITTYPGTIANRTIIAALREVGDFLKGEDPRNIEAIWHKLLRAFTYVGTRGATTALISGIDIALWDLKGQALGVPISFIVAPLPP